MKEIIKNTQELKRIFDFYLVQINRGINPVYVHSGDIAQMKTYLEKLSKSIRSISPTLSSELSDIHEHLYVSYGPGLYVFNPYRFGALGAVLRYLQSPEFACDTAKYLHTPWKDVNDALKKLLEDANSVNTRIDYNQVGVAARELFIMLAKKVFTPEIQKVAAGRNIGISDAKGMLEAFFDYKSTDDDVKKYAKETIKLAEPLTHTKSENNEKMKTVVMSVVCLVAIVDAVIQS